MSKKSSSSSSTTQKTTTTTTNLNATDNEGLTIVGNTSAVSLTDPGAFELAAEVTLAAIEALSTQSANALQGAREFAEGQSKESLDFAAGLAQPETAISGDIIRFGTLAAVAVAFIMVRKKG